MMRTIILALLLVGLNPAGSISAEHDMGFFPPDEVKWGEGPQSLPLGARLAVLEGDPTKEGPYVMRIKMPDGYKIPLHTHPKVERVTVISGNLHIEMSDNHAARKMTPGTYGFWPAGMKHAVWAEGETVVQLHGIGPWAIEYVNPADDPRRQR